MATQTDTPELSPGRALTEFLAGYRLFLENLYSLFRFLEGELTRPGWDIVKTGGYMVTRNGAGSGLANFASANWMTTFMGIAFVATGVASVKEATTNTKIPTEGLDVLFFQARWLDWSPEEPVVWGGRLRAIPEGPAAPRKWEDYQTAVFWKLAPEPGTSGGSSGNLRSDRALVRGSAMAFSGTYTEVPMALLLSQEDVVSRLVEPALAVR